MFIQENIILTTRILKTRNFPQVKIKAQSKILPQAITLIPQIIIMETTQYQIIKKNF